MSDVVGLTLHEDRIDCVVVRRGLGRVRVQNTFSVSLGEDAEAALRVKLQERRVRTRHVHVGIPRRRTVVKVLELPRVAETDLRRAMGFELERHLPFSPADAIFDYHVLDDTPGRPTRVLLVAAERRVFERVEQLLRGVGFTPRLVDVAIHSLAVLVARGRGAQAHEGCVVVHLEEGEAELAIVRRGRPVLSRAFPLPHDAKERSQTLGDELRRSLGSLPPDEREAVADVIVTGNTEMPGADWAGLPVHTDIPLVRGLGGASADSASTPALAMALRRPGRGLLRTNLIPDALRPRPFPRAVAATLALAAVTLLLGLSIPGVTAIRAERRLAALNRAINELAPEVREVEQIVRTVKVARREVETLRAFEAQHIRALPVLRELTELLPPDAWLTTLSINAKGIEMAGFANAASQLIPLLEASPTFEHVQFTSPVTKGRDREQFRLKAGWEQLPNGAAPPAGSASPAPESAPGRQEGR